MGRAAAVPIAAGVLWCGVVWCGMVWYDVQCNAVHYWCSTCFSTVLQCSSVPHCTTLCSIAIQYITAPQFSTFKNKVPTLNWPSHYLLDVVKFCCLSPVTILVLVHRLLCLCSCLCFCLFLCYMYYSDGLCGAEVLPLRGVSMRIHAHAPSLF